MPVFHEFSTGFPQACSVFQHPDNCVFILFLCIIIQSLFSADFSYFPIFFRITLLSFETKQIFTSFPQDVVENFIFCRMQDYSVFVNLFDIKPPFFI